MQFYQLNKYQQTQKLFVYSLSRSVLLAKGSAAVFPGREKSVKDRTGEEKEKMHLKVMPAHWQTADLFNKLIR